jgi:hypothetical protein
MPSAQAAEHLAFFWRVELSEATVRRHTEAAGAAYVAVQTAEVERLERELPAPPPGPPVQQVSADGAMVPLVGGATPSSKAALRGAEVKTVAVGTVARGPGDGAARPRQLSYFSRRAEHATFARLALAELHRRGTATAGTVVGVMDGAAWLQGFLDYHRPDAVRVLDFPHALEHLGAVAPATFGPGTAAAGAWLDTQADALKHGAPSAVLVALAELPLAAGPQPGPVAQARDATFGYLAKRLEPLRYAEFLAQGYPIGSGAVESANKLVVEARLKGSGMHWAPAHVDPPLALRTVACADRWTEAWPQICGRLRGQARARRAARRRARRPAPPPALPPPPAAVPHARAVVRPKLVVDGRPTADHPWKRRPFHRGSPRPTSPHAKP